MSIPGKGQFDNFQSFLSPFGAMNFDHFEPTREDIYDACVILDQEYRSTGVRLDDKHIDDKIRKRLSARRLKNFAMFLPVVPNIINEENPNYVKPPRRLFTINDEPVADNVNKYLHDLYEEMNFNNEILYMSRQAGYMGTILAFPAIDEDTKKMDLIKLTPADRTLNVIPDPDHPSQALEVSYDSETADGSRVENIWDLDNFTTRVHTPAGISETVIPHEFDGMPIAILRYSTDSNRFWGAFDGGLLSLVETRSLLVADSVYRTQTSLIEFLVFMGFSGEEAIAAAKTRNEGVLAFENEKDDSGKPQAGSKDIKYVAPEGLTPEKLFDLWEQIFKAFMNARGHQGKNFESSKMVSTAESMRFGNIAMIELKESRRGPLLDFEQNILDRIVWANNAFGGKVTIPDGIQVTLDWQPDKQFFNNATDEANAHKFSLNNNLTTPPDIIRQQSPEMSREEALQKYEDNKKFNEENDVGFQDEVRDLNKKPSQDDSKDDE